MILLAVRWYLRYGLSYRDIEELLAERGVDVDHVTTYRWVQRFTPLVIEAARPCRHSVGDRWFVDETYVKVAGVWRYVYRAVDQWGQVIDVRVSRRGNIAAARSFFETMLAGRGRPREVTTDLAAIRYTVDRARWFPRAARYLRSNSHTAAAQCRHYEHGKPIDRARGLVASAIGDSRRTIPPLIPSRRLPVRRALEESSGSESIGDEVFKLGDGEADASADSNWDQLVAPNELVDGGSTDCQDLGGALDVDEERSARLFVGNTRL